MPEINNEFIELRNIPPEDSSVFEALAQKKLEYIAKFPGDEEARGIEFNEVLSYLRDLKIRRDEQATNPSYYNIPTRLVEAGEQERITHRLKVLEMTYSPDGTKAGYLNGSATTPDEIRERSFSDRPLWVTTGEHGTDHATGNGELNSGRKIGGADWGLGGLSDLMAEELGGVSLTMTGRQTGNGNGDPDHPFGQRLSHVIARDDSIRTSLQLHGASQGKVAKLADELPLDVLIGIGATPNEASLRAAEIIQEIGTEFGLRVVINQRFVRFVEVRLPSGLVVTSPRPRADGSVGIAYDNFKAAGEYTTRSIAERAFSFIGIDDAVTIQLELVSPLRTMPNDVETITKRTRAIGPYMTYLLLKTFYEETAPHGR